MTKTEGLVLPKIPISLAERVKALEMQLSRHKQELGEVNLRLFRAEQKVIKLKAKIKKLKEEADYD